MTLSQRVLERAASPRRALYCLVLFVVLSAAARADGQTSVSIDLGTTNAPNGMACPSTGDGDNTPVTMGGVNCRRNLDSASDYYMYFNVSDSFAFQGSKPRVDITITYYDSGTTALGIDYDAASEPYKQGGAVALTNTNTWKQHTWQLSDAYFGNRENYGTDFRISGCCSGIYFYLDVVQVAVPTGPAAPMIAPVSSPDPATVGTTYSKQLTLLQGNPAPTWAMLQGPEGAEITGTGLVSGWTPSPCDVGSPVTFQVRAENNLGSDTETWTASAQFASAGNSLILNDPLQGSTIAPSTGGAISGGTFVAGGWKVTGGYDCIFWHVTPIPHGAFEYDVTGLGEGCSVSNKNELSHMYDWTFGNADYQYTGGYRDGPYKHFIRKQCDPGRERTCELLWVMAPCVTEPDSSALSWSATATYRFRVEWEPAGDDTVARIFRDGTLLWDGTCAGSYTPGGISVRIGASNRHAGEDAYIGAVYSNVKVWDLSIPPTTPPVIKEVTPDPDVAWFGHQYSRQLDLLEGSPAPAWCLLQGPAGARIDAASGLVNGWTASHDQIGKLVTFEAKAANVAGADTESWSVLVKARGDLDRDGDCDQSDFGLFQVCFSGLGIPRPSGCEDADLDGNNDVSEIDFVKFRACISGADYPVDPHCAD